MELSALVLLGGRAQAEVLLLALALVSTELDVTENYFHKFEHGKGGGVRLKELICTSQTWHHHMNYI